jgi:elongation factor 2
MQCPETYLTVVKSCLPRRRGRVLTQEQHHCPKKRSMYTLKASLPVAESFGFPAEIHARSRGNASVDMTFDSWECVPGC